MIKFFTVEQVIEIHDAFLEDHGGLPGIRDKGLLISAVEMPRASMFGEYLHKTIYDKAGAYLFHIWRTDPPITAVVLSNHSGCEMVKPCLDSLIHQ